MSENVTVRHQTNGLFPPVDLSSLDVDVSMFDERPGEETLITATGPIDYGELRRILGDTPTEVIGLADDIPPHPVNFQNGYGDRSVYNGTRMPKHAKTPAQEVASAKTHQDFLPIPSEVDLQGEYPRSALVGGMVLLTHQV